METKITCPHCSSKNCFESVLNESINYLCCNCGYCSSSLLKIGSDIVLKAEQKSPQLVVALKKTDTAREIEWYLSVISTNKGILFPEGTINNWKWAVSPVVKLSEEEKKNYPIPGTNEFYETRLAVEQSSYFSKNDFINALTKLGAVISQ